MSQYKVEFLPANISIQAGKTQGAVNTIESILNRYASDGYDLVQVAQVSVAETAGCLGMLMGQKNSLVVYNMMVFKK